MEHRTITNKPAHILIAGEELGAAGPLEVETAERTPAGPSSEGDFMRAAVAPGNI